MKHSCEGKRKSIAIHSICTGKYNIKTDKQKKKKYTYLTRCGLKCR